MEAQHRWCDKASAGDGEGGVERETGLDCGTRLVQSTKQRERDVENAPLPIERTIKRLADRYSACMFASKPDRRDMGFIARSKLSATSVWGVSPALIPERSGERVKTNRRDAVTHENGRRTEKRSMAGFYPA